MTVQRPPMGWNSWNTFGSEINEELIRTTADCMVSEGFLDAGYEYLVIDDCWAEKQRDEKGRLVASREKFPSGMKAVSDYVHGKGLKFGMYSSAGSLTCAGYPASFGHEFTDAQTFAEWGVDFLKYDYCFKPTHEYGPQLYRRMGTALANCGRDILFSACSWGADNTREWIKTTGAHMWRSTGDIRDNWESVKALYEIQRDTHPYNGAGCFNDMDMLVVGMNGKGHAALGGCTPEEYRTHFSIWAMFGSPLMMGCDVRSCDAETRALLQNRAIIEVDQDPAYRQPYLANAVNAGSGDVWCRMMANGDLVLGMFNFFDSAREPFVAFADLGLGGSPDLALSITDLWTGEELGVFKDLYRSPAIGAHCCRMLRCKVLYG